MNETSLNVLIGKKEYESPEMEVVEVESGEGFICSSACPCQYVTY